MSFRLKLGVYSVCSCVCVLTGCSDDVSEWWWQELKSSVSWRVCHTSQDSASSVSRNVASTASVSLHSPSHCAVRFVAAFRSVVSDILLMVLHWQIVGYSHFESYSRQNEVGTVTSWTLSLDLGPWVVVYVCDAYVMHVVTSDLWWKGRGFDSRLRNDWASCSHHLVPLSSNSIISHQSVGLQCFDAVGLAAGRASGLWKNWVVRYWHGYLSGARCK